MEPKSIPITRTQYENFAILQVKKHKNDWWAVFSVNAREEVWPFICYGPTPKEMRKFVILDENKLLREMAGLLVDNIDERGGRFFIDRLGAYYQKGEDETKNAAQTTPEPFIQWRPDEDLPLERFRSLSDTNIWSPPSSKTFSEYLKDTRP